MDGDYIDDSVINIVLLASMLLTATDDILRTETVVLALDIVPVLYVAAVVANIDAR